jgi:hypothetical protein
MKSSELRKRLEEIENEIGDLEVFCLTGWGEFVEPNPEFLTPTSEAESTRIIL